MKDATLQQPGYMRLLDPEALLNMRRLELIARGVVEGFVSGRHRSPYKGFSAEFAEHREYVVGDDIRMLDWKVYAKSDRYCIKQFEQETNLRCLLLLDASNSMAYAGASAARHSGRRVSKFQYAQFLAATLAHLMIGQQDAVGLATFDTKPRRYSPARSRTTHLRVLLEELDATATGGETSLAPIFHDLAERIPRCGLVVVISDLFDEIDQLLNALHHFRYRKHEVLLLHVMAEEELTFPFEKWTQFRDLEVHGRHLHVDPVSLRAAYLAHMSDHITRLRQEAGQMKMDYVQLSTARSFDTALAHYLAQRMSRKK